MDNNKSIFNATVNPLPNIEDIYGLPVANPILRSTLQYIITDYDSPLVTVKKSIDDTSEYLDELIEILAMGNNISEDKMIALGKKMALNLVSFFMLIESLSLIEPVVREQFIKIVVSEKQRINKAKGD